jgi:sulfotransferase
MKHFFFQAGLPRSGSTLLSSIFNQNPEIYASTNSPVRELMQGVQNYTINSEQYLAYPKPKALASATLGVLQNYYQDEKASIIIDKSREWAMPDSFNLLKSLLPYKPKVIVNVRSILEILSSFISLVNNTKQGSSRFDKKIEEIGMSLDGDINDIRCEYLMRAHGIIDNALYGISYAISEPEHFYILEYDNLISNTSQTIDEIYEFLEIQSFDHNLDNIINTVKENDDVYGLPGMHDVRPQILKKSIDPEKVLSKNIIEKYSNLEFWR